MLEREYGCRAALQHPPHVTLHPPFVPREPIEGLIQDLALAASAIQKGEVSLGEVDAFIDERGSPSQVILRIEGRWCRHAHHVLLERLAVHCRDQDEELQSAWPTEHRGDGFVAHTSLAIGDLPSDLSIRSSICGRARRLFNSLVALLEAPHAFTAEALHLIAYSRGARASRYTEPPRTLAVLPLRA